MGIIPSCGKDVRKELVVAIGEGDLHHVKLLLDRWPKLIRSSFSHSSHTPLHFAASHGQPDVLLLLIENGASVDALNHHRQTPLMLACNNGRLACIEPLVEKGANVLIFDSAYGRTCLHYAAKSGHLLCLQKVLSAAQLPSVARTWGFSQFINVRDGSGATPLHLAARSCHSPIVRVLLSNGALVSATTTRSSKSSSSLGFGSTPLHFAAQGGSTECVKELLAWGADRMQRNSQGHTPFYIAVKYHNTACATLLNPLTAEPLVWPSPWNFMRNLDPEAKLLLEAALMQANDVWEKQIFAVANGEICESDKLHHVEVQDEEEEEEADVCCICFEQICTIEVQECGHQMCAGCMLALCCHNKPNPSLPNSPAPACPFCRCKIEQLKRVQPKEVEQECAEGDKQQLESVQGMDRELAKVAPMNPHKKPGDGGSGGSSSSSSSFMGLVSKGSFRLLASARGSSGRVADIDWY